MQCILREKLLANALLLAEVSQIYRTDSSRFVDSYFDWLEKTEKELNGLRSPISIVLQAEKSLLSSVLDGYVPQYVQTEKSVRKRQRAIAAQSLERISKEIHAKIESIDHTLEQLNEKLCHAIAVLASKDHSLYENLQANQQGIDMVWEKLGSTPETIPMFNYFCAKLPATDRNYLLMDIIQKIGTNKTPAPK